MERPDKDRNTHVARAMNFYECDENTAVKILSFGETAWDAGKSEGHRECQRHLRLILGIEEPTESEAAYWDAPFPLTKKDMKG